MTQNRTVDPPGGVPLGTNKRVGEHSRDAMDTDEFDADGTAVKRTRSAFDFQGLPTELADALAKEFDQLGLNISKRIGNKEPQGQENKPWASEWKAERLYIAVPTSGYSSADNLINQAILAGVRDSPTRVTFVAGQGANDVPEPSVQDERFLCGLLTAYTAKEPPRTLKCGGSSLIDLTYHAAWSLAASRLASDREKRGKIHPSVLPEKPIGGGKASDLFVERFRALKGTIGLEHAHIVDTLERVLKLWAEDHAEKTRQLLLSTKISWNLVLSKGGEFRSKVVGKKKDQQIRLLSTPLNPKDAAWVMPFERKLVGHLTAPIWGGLDDLSKAWASLTSRESHAQFDLFVKNLKDLYKQMHRVSDSMVRRLGLRKSVVLNSPSVKRLSKKDLKDKKPNNLVQVFVKTDLRALPKGAKALFEPFYIAEQLPQYEELFTVLGTENYLAVLSSQERRKALASSYLKGQAKTLWLWEERWFDSFSPPIDLSPQDRPRDVLETSNMFEGLDTN